MSDIFLLLLEDTGAVDGREERRQDGCSDRFQGCGLSKYGRVIIMAKNIPSCWLIILGVANIIAGAAGPAARWLRDHATWYGEQVPHLPSERVCFAL